MCELPVFYATTEGQTRRIAERLAALLHERGLDSRAIDVRSPDARDVDWVAVRAVAVGASVHLAEQIDSMPHLQLVGLMTMAPLTEDLDVARFVFARTREVFEEMKWHKIGGNSFRHLSMGMSNDFEPAILEGATMVRVGTAIFGPRPAQA